MTYVEHDTYGNHKETVHTGPGLELMGANTLIGERVHNMHDEPLGTIKEFMVDMRTGRVEYAVLSFGGIFSVGEKLFAVPWSALKLDTVDKCFILDIDIECCEKAPGSGSNSWPNMIDRSWIEGICTYYGPAAG